MRFWQAVVTAQLAAGSVYVDRYDPLWKHAAMEVCNVALAGILWLVFKRIFRERTTP